MAATTTVRLTPTKGPYPARGTFPMPANTLIGKGWIVQLNASDQAIPGANANGFKAIGKASQTFDNQTGSEAGGTAGDLDCEVEYGVFGWEGEAGNLPTIGDKCYVADNQTVSTSSSGGTRGVAGRCVEVRDGKYWVMMNPLEAWDAAEDATDTAAIATNAADIATNAADIATNAADIATNAAAIAALEADVTSTDNQFEVPLGTFRLSTGASIAAFSDGVADGFELYGSEALGIRWNDDGTDVIVANVVLPSDLDPTADLVLEFDGATIGGNDPTTTLTVGIYFHPAGVAGDADDDAGGATTAFDGATTVVTTETLTVAAANIPAASVAMTITITPSAALDQDDFILFGIRGKYTGVALT